MASETAVLISRRPHWQRRIALVRRSARFMPAVELLTLLAALAISTGSYFIVTGRGSPAHLLSPPLVALLMVANLVPAMAVLVLLARRIAKGRAAASPIGGRGRLHVRLVALFSTIAAVPTLLVVIFASLLFQYGVAFWFSDSARVVLENSDRVARAYVSENEQRIRADIVPMLGDFRNALAQASIEDPRFIEFVAQQGRRRGLSEIAIIEIGKDGVRRAPLVALADVRSLERRLPNLAVPGLDRGDIWASTGSGDRIESAIALNPATRSYLYASRFVDPLVLRQVSRTQTALGDYNSLLERSRSLQIRFNAALLLVSLLIVGAAIWIALTVADRLVRPVSELVGAARRVAAGDLAVRVRRPHAQDEVGTLASAFNRMTRRLEEQTGALVSANSQLDNRRVFIEAVLSGVSAGVVSVDRDRRVRLINRSAEDLLVTDSAGAVGRPLAEIAPELDRLLDSDEREAIVQIGSAGEPRTLAAKLVRSDSGDVLTFDDITQQLLDQRRAAWSDVARRIAHEIKNPLTPIQLAAERLQRRYGREIASDPATFERLTGTIVRQVGDLRRMVDEFSSFARMPKPSFRAEAIGEVARQALFLHEVAHPAIRFALDAPDPSPLLVCDRRQLGQALTNLIKNAIEAIAAAREEGGEVVLTIGEDGGRLTVDVADNGVGLPAERDRITEPYMTTRARGTGLGLAIVKKIVEEHCGTMHFTDRPGGGTVVHLCFDRAMLATLEGGGQDHGGDSGAARPSELTRMKAG